MPAELLTDLQQPHKNEIMDIHTQEQQKSDSVRLVNNRVVLPLENDEILAL